MAFRVVPACQRHIGYDEEAAASADQLNAATSEELPRVPGIGPATTGKILVMR
jgi:DNA uptake protein ComE-like DNA-binding protein